MKNIKNLGKTLTKSKLLMIKGLGMMTDNCQDIDTPPGCECDERRKPRLMICD